MVIIGGCLFSIVQRRRPFSSGQATLDARQISQFLFTTECEELQWHGIWYDGELGTTAIFCINLAYGRARQNELRQGVMLAENECSCLEGRRYQHGKWVQPVKGHFASHGYNAGRRAPTQSQHRVFCALWRPPSSGNLHSWRREWDVAGGKTG